MTTEQLNDMAAVVYPIPNELEYLVGAADATGEVYDYTHPSYYDDKRIAEAQRAAYIKGLETAIAFAEWYRTYKMDKYPTTAEAFTYWYQNIYSLPTGANENLLTTPSGDK